jgi:uncharacterized metal-binding protein
METFSKERRMSDCCGSKQDRKPESSSCCGGDKRTVLLYACSGGANVAEVADRAARELMFAGDGTMFCLAGLGGDIQGMVQTARDADVNLVIDGCPMECAKKVFDRHGITNYRYVKVTDLGIGKVKGIRCTREQIDKATGKARELLAQ